MKPIAIGGGKAKIVCAYISTDVLHKILIRNRDSVNTNKSLHIYKRKIHIQENVIFTGTEKKYSVAYCHFLRLAGYVGK